MPPQTNRHTTLSVEERFNRMSDCIDIMYDPNATPEAKRLASKKKYKLLHPDRIKEEQNSRRRQQYANDPEYRRKEI
jgi:hypothetical protein